MKLTKQQAIELRIPQSGDKALDDMIRAANRRETALSVLNGILSSSPDVINWEIEFLKQRVEQITNELL